MVCSGIWSELDILHAVLAALTVRNAVRIGRVDFPATVKNKFILIRTGGEGNLNRPDSVASALHLGRSPVIERTREFHDFRVRGINAEFHFLLRGLGLNLLAARSGLASLFILCSHGGYLLYCS